MGKFYQCIQSYGPSFMTKFCSVLYLENLLTNIFAKLNLRGIMHACSAFIIIGQKFESQYLINDSFGTSTKCSCIDVPALFTKRSTCPIDSTTFLAASQSVTSTMYDSILGNLREKMDINVPCIALSLS